MSCSPNGTRRMLVSNLLSVELTRASQRVDCVHDVNSVFCSRDPHSDDEHFFKNKVSCYLVLSFLSCSLASCTDRL